MDEGPVCLLKQEDETGVVLGWVLADDAPSLRRNLETRSWEDPAYSVIAAELYRREFWPAGRYALGPGGSCFYTLLVGNGV